MTLLMVFVASAQLFSAPAQSVAGSDKASTFARLSGSEVGETLLQLLDAGLRDEQEEVRYAAAAALSRILQRRSAPPEPGMSLFRDLEGLAPALLDTLNDPDFRVRAVAVEALPQLIGADEFESVALAFSERFYAEDHEIVRSMLVYGLGKGPSAPDAALRALEMALRDPSTKVRGKAALSAGQLRQPRLLPLLMSALEQEPEEGIDELLFAVGQFGPLARPFRARLGRLESVSKGGRRELVREVLKKVGK